MRHIRSWALTGLKGLALALITLPCSLALFILTVLSLALIPVGGAFTTPSVLGLVRQYADRRRALAAEWGGVRIPATYLPYPEGVRGGIVGRIQRCACLLKDPARWRDFGWLTIDMTAGFALAVLVVGLTYYPFEGFALGAGLWRAFSDDGRIGYWYGFVPISGQASGLAAAALGAVLLPVGYFAAPWILRSHFLLTKTVLGGSAELEQRVRQLTRTRSDAVDTSAAELRRIERDLHDGAQARLVAMGMSLGAIEALIEKDPAKAKEMVAKARGDSALALDELRGLVRGIHPPVLAERGLGPAVEALALRMPLPVEVQVDVPGRAAEPVESAAYFAVSEVLTNAAKHSGADRVWLDVDHRDGMLRIAVTDDGRGGADPGGSGLRGIERRLGTFDGVLAVSSPSGGPTLVTMEIPCALSSQKTSFS